MKRLTGVAIILWSLLTVSAPISAQEEMAAPTIEQTPPAPSFFESIDHGFGKAVEVMNAVLFYRLGKTERQYVVYEWSSAYVRDRGSDDPFVELESSDVYADKELSDEDIELLSARGLITAGDIIDGQQQPYRLGTIGDRAIEYVTVKGSQPDPYTRDELQFQLNYGDKFVRTNIDFKWVWARVGTKRGLLSPQDTLLVQEIEELAEQGRLRLADDPVDPSSPYLLTETTGGIPVVVAWLSCGAVFFTLYMRFFNIWGFRHAIDVVRGKYDDPNDAGEVTHFQALASALSATVGLGNIAGVTIAMTIGGPGAFFWMLLCGLFGMTSKFVECTLGQKYRHVKPDGTVLGGPMRYLQAGLQEMNLGLLGAFLSIVFTIMCILASFGGGNMFQANQSGGAVLQMFQRDDLQELSNINSRITAAANAEDTAQLQTLQQQRTEIQERLAGTEKIVKPVFGLVLAALVAVVIIGGIKRIGAAAGKVVPTMCLLYVGACLYIIVTHLGEVPPLISSIFTEAFSGAAMGGGLIGVLVIGVQRAAFSNEAGVGSAAIAHSAAKTAEPVREGCVALLGPFIDTIVVCSMTALVILITGAWDNNDWVVDQQLAGAALTSKAFESQISWFPYVLSVAVVLFAYSTIISWSYYGEKSWETLFGARSIPVYKVLSVVAVFIGTIVNLGSVLDFSDMMILGMAFPNIAGVVLLAPKIKRDLAEYWSRYRTGEFKTFR